MEKGDRKNYVTGMEEAPENGKESLHYAHANGMNERVHYHFHTILLLVPILSQVIPVHILSPYIIKIHFNIIIPHILPSN